MPRRTDMGLLQGFRAVFIKKVLNSPALIFIYYKTIGKENYKLFENIPEPTIFFSLKSK